MLKDELIKRSPIRVLEQTIHGGLGRGNLGVITARKGVGKTACLAHLAIDKMMSGRNVLHISFADNPHHVEEWYKQVFNELSNHYKLENAYDTFEEVIHHRLIIHFKQKEITFDQISDQIKLIEGGSSFNPDIIIVDGRDFETVTRENLEGWKEFANTQDTEIWFAAVLHRENLQIDDKGIPAPVNSFTDLFSVIIMLEPGHEFIQLNLLKDHDSKDLEKLRLKLDPKTMLISNHRI